MKKNKVRKKFHNRTKWYKRIIDLDRISHEVCQDGLTDKGSAELKLSFSAVGQWPSMSGNDRLSKGLDWWHYTCRWASGVGGSIL